MLLAPRLLEHALVGDLVQHVVLEDELARALEGARLAPVGELAPRQAVERVACGRGDPLQRLVPEHVADHAGLLQRRLLRPAAGRRCAPAGRRSSVDGTRTSSSLSAETRHGSLRRDDDAVVDQHADQLLDEVRDCPRRCSRAGRAAPPARSRAGAAALRSARACRASRAARGRCADGRSGRCPRAAAARKASSASGREQEQRQVAAGLREVIDEVERAVVGPMQVVEQEHDRRAVLSRAGARKYDARAWKARSRICLPSLAIAAMCGSAP